VRDPKLQRWLDAVGATDILDWSLRAGSWWALVECADGEERWCRAPAEALP